jgi:hypothetical protein
MASFEPYDQFSAGCAPLAAFFWLLTSSLQPLAILASLYGLPSVSVSDLADLAEP